jgi:DNA-directed RNA polymerase subunit RPC12/RpoP
MCQFLNIQNPSSQLPWICMVCMAEKVNDNKQRKIGPGMGIFLQLHVKHTLYRLLSPQVVRYLCARCSSKSGKSLL